VHVCEGIVAKWAHGRCEPDGCSTSRLQIKNPDYSQMEGRRKVFEARRDARQQRRSGWPEPVLRHGRHVIPI
jgi:hypothetical protein